MNSTDANATSTATCSTARRDRAGPPVPEGDPLGDRDQEIVAHFRTLMSAFPSGVCVVTTQWAGKLRGATCSSLASVTLSPPTLLVCLHESSGTLESIEETGLFAVNLIHARGQEAAKVFASHGPDRFGSVSWTTLKSSGLPYLADDAFAVASCQRSESAVVGDHVVVFGEVFDIHLSPDVPLLYGLRRYSSWPHDELSTLEQSHDGAPPTER